MAERGYPEIRPAHSQVFRYLEDGGSRVVDLAVKAGITKQSMAYLVHDLLSAGYVMIDSDPDDRRAKRVQFSKKGQNAKHAIESISRDLEADLSKHMCEDELETMRRSLQMAVDQLKNSGFR
jgi:DNA-binding MarR family transcriptional regulator